MSDKILVAKVLLEQDGKFLVVRKTENYDWKAGKWEVPGGKVEENEDLFEAAKREVEEETALKIKNLERVVKVEIQKDECVRGEILHTSSFSGSLQLSDEHQEYRWVRAEEFRKMDWHRDAGYTLPAMAYLDEYI